MVRSRDRHLVARRIRRRDGLLPKDRRRRDDNRRRARRTNSKGNVAPAAARRGAFAGGQGPRHRGVGRVGCAQRPASQAPASRFHATAVKETLAADPSRRLQKRYRRGTDLYSERSHLMGTFNSSHTVPYHVEDLSPVAQDVMRHFEQQDYEVTETPIPTGGVQVSIRKGGTFKAIIGLKTALNVRIESVANGTKVEAGVGIFGQQAIPTAVTLLVFWTVILAQVWNMAQEAKLDAEALGVAEQSLKAHSEVSSGAAAE